MAVTKRTRFEVLRRDNHTCQYCGAKAPDVTLHIDHVMPVSLGGDDKPGNLVTACKDCNSGKSSITPDSPLVKGLSERAAAYALGMQNKMTRFRADLEELADYEDTFLEMWNRWTLKSTGKPLPLALGYKMSLFKWRQTGVPLSVFELIIPMAHEKYNRFDGLKEDSVFKYMAGILTNMLDQREVDLSLTEDTVAVYTSEEAEEYAAREWSSGAAEGARKARRSATVHDPLRNHVDGTEPAFYEWPDGRKYPTGKVVKIGEG
ncbi:HNH endonuclease [Leucobacter sp. G161]|uniref:HNH endonuclease n=1 Tax=Leucobacter sp. G161 TaxID=663704 RepID=UPI00073AFAB0|nr:HNH endonuclease [Leucobacter sp. G161]KUF05675.1 hypothetical protein AUL38_15890 [Leucobacter sp. G161]